MTKNYRKAQIEATLHRKLATILQFQIADPRLQNLLITTVTLSKKLDYVDIKVIQQQFHGDQKIILDSLQHAKSKIRFLLAKEFTQSRTIPKIRFHYDDTFSEKVVLNSMIDQFENNTLLS